MPTEGEQKLLAAATSEFAECGLAGARVDRIAARANTNKQLIYAYFGDKQGLFDAVVRDQGAQLNSAVPLDAGRLADWVIDLFDFIVEHPEIMRLVAWQFLERAEVVRDTLMSDYAPYVKAVKRVQAAGEVSSEYEALDLIVLLAGLATSWYNAFAPLHGVTTDAAWSRRTLNRHRRALRLAAEALIEPATG